MKRILFFTNRFYPETFRGNDIAFHLAEKGYAVTVLTDIPNYPHGHYFEGYGLFKKRVELINGVKVIRVPVIPRGKGGKVRMIMNYGSGLFFMMLYAFYQAIFHKFDAIFIQQLSPAFIALPAVMVRKIRNIPSYMWILDLWPDSLVAGGITNRKIFKATGKMMDFIYKRTDKILISSLGFRGILCERGVPNEKILYFPNWSEDTIVSGDAKVIPLLPAGFKIMFAGNIGEAQNFDNLMEVMLKLKYRKDIQWVVVGDGRKKAELDSFVLKNELTDTVSLLGRYDISYMATFFEAADIMLVSLNNEFVFNATLPAKVQAYMSAQKPIVGFISGEGKYVIEKAKCGFCAEADDVDGFVELVQTLPSLSKEELSGLGANGYAYYEDNFKKSVCMSNLISIIEN